MSCSKKFVKRFIISLIGFALLNASVSAQGVTLYTPYTKIAVPPGETINYTIDVINHGNARKNVDIRVSAMPQGWTYDLKSGGWNVKQLSLLPGGKKTLSLKVNVPYKVKKGTFRFKVIAGSQVLPLYVEVSRQGTYKTDFTCKQTNMEGTSKSGFTFSTELKNLTGEKQRYALQSAAPRGWSVIFKPNYKQATSVEIEPNQKVNMTIEVKPPHSVQAGTYKIPVRVVTNNSSAALTLEVVITGNYDMELTTPTGLLSTKITAGDERKVELLVRNTGSAKLDNIQFFSTKPVNWEVTFDPKTVDELGPGQTAEVYATIKAYKKAVAGDYVAKIRARTPEVSSSVTFRITVKTPMLMGWLGIFIILVALGSVWYLFRKFGRR